MITKIGELERKIIMERRNQEIIRYYRAAQKGVRAKLMTIDVTDFQRYKIQKTLTEVNQIIRGLDPIAREWSKEAVVYAYKSGVAMSGNELQKIANILKVDFDAPIHRSAVNVLADNTTMDFLSANATMMKNIDRFLLTTQQRLIEDQAISKMIAEGIISGETRRAVSDRIYREFQKRMVDEQFIVINGRHYRPDYYAELVARTRTVEAANQGAINTSLYYENDLMQVSAHSDACEECQPIQGRVYSISGTNDDFPALDTIEIPVHPHCRHFLVPVNELILRERGEYEGLAKISRSQEKIKTFADYEAALR